MLRLFAIGTSFDVSLVRIIIVLWKGERVIIVYTLHEINLVDRGFRMLLFVVGGGLTRMRSIP